MSGFPRYLSLGLLLLTPLACSKHDGDDKDEDEGPDPSVWMVGDNGTMVPPGGPT